MSQHKEIQVGSRAFFNSFEDFNSKDNDVVILEREPKLYNFYFQQKQNNKDIFRWNVDNIFNYDYSKQPMAIGKFLVPEILNNLNKNFNDVKTILEEFIPKLEKRHYYQKIIFDSYILNGKMELTKEQLEEAYNAYINNKPNNAK